MNNAEVIKRLRGAKGLAAKLGGQGMYVPLTVEEQAVLTAVSEAAQTGAFEWEWQADVAERAAGLRRGDLALLLAVLHWQEVQADPQGAIIECLALLQGNENRPATS